jgi:NADPH-dependent 2,4-dienoyl-CoA reductase/sulfur reductase-like enzyme
MGDRISLRIDGRRVEAEAGITVAAALENAGCRELRKSVSGQGRGVLCAMGICFECRVSIDGVPHRRACMEIVREGMCVATAGDAAEAAAGAADGGETARCDVAVVGAGPAGIAAACRAAEAGARTVLLEEAPASGGQIHRHLPGRPFPRAARTWLERLARSGAVVFHGAAVFDVAPREGGLRVEAEAGQRRLAVFSRAVVLATGARELFLPFPGWTLPGVYGAGGAQALWKTGASLRGRRAIVAGTGPLLLPVAASLAKAGARVELVAEQSGSFALSRFAAGLLRHPGKLVEAARYRSAFRTAPYRTGTWVAEAQGDGRLEGVALDGPRGRLSADCDLLAVGYGLTPNTELARLLGCALRGTAVAVGARQETSIPGVFSAGEPCGVAGADVALAEGEIAGLAAAGRTPAPGEWARLSGARSRGRRLAAAMDRAFGIRPEILGLAREDTIVCRCEDVALGRLAGCSGSRQAKLATRAGMGPCQGRVCGAALRCLLGWESDTVRPPAKPARLGHLDFPEDDA